jgi:hypothetical protein
MSGSINAEERRLAQQRQQDCLNAAIFSGCKASATALVVSGGLCAGLLKYSEVRMRSRVGGLFLQHFVAQLMPAMPVWRIVGGFDGRQQ